MYPFFMEVLNGSVQQAGGLSVKYRVGFFFFPAIKNVYFKM